MTPARIPRPPRQQYVAMLCVTFIVAAAYAEQPGAQSATIDTDDEREQRLEAMQQIAEAITVEARENGDWREVELIEGPRFRFSNPETPCYDATVWIWGTRGRPIALLTLSAEREQVDDPGYWAYELTSLSPAELRASSPDGWRWTPQKAGLNFEPFPDAPSVADNPGQRLRQMKALARRFDSYGIYPVNRRVPMRVLPTPLLRYEDEDAGIRDGALFVLAGGTDPEALLVIELSATGSGDPLWQFAINRVSSGELHVSLDGREIWSCSRRDDVGQRSPYCLFHRPMETAQDQ